MNGPIEWFASITGMIAAAMIAYNYSVRVSGAGFVLFVFASIAWIISGMQAGTMPLAVQNMVLLAINLFGVWRYLIVGKPPEASVEE